MRLIKATVFDTSVILGFAFLLAMLFGWIGFISGIFIRHREMVGALLFVVGALFPVFLAVTFQPRLVFSAQFDDEALEFAIGHRKKRVVRSDVKSITPFDFGSWKYLVIATTKGDLVLINLLWSKRDYEALSQAVIDWRSGVQDLIVLSLNDVSKAFRPSAKELLGDWAYYGLCWSPVICVTVCLGALFGKLS